MKKRKPLFYKKYVIEKSLQHHVIEWCAVAGSLTGAIMVAKHIQNGYLIWLVANILWIFFAAKHKHWGLLFLSVCYLVIHAYGFIKW